LKESGKGSVTYVTFVAAYGYQALVAPRTAHNNRAKETEIYLGSNCSSSPFSYLHFAVVICMEGSERHGTPKQGSDNKKLHD
jgi:hypothetical protein